MKLIKKKKIKRAKALNYLKRLSKRVHLQSYLKIYFGVTLSEYV